jgi:chromosome segregation ATPase
MALENQALKEELARQKEKYEAEITKLNRNIAFKDELLDECEKEIGGLRRTYQLFMGQFGKVKADSAGKQYNLGSAGG